MLHPLLEKYIPSRSYVEFLKAQNTTFTDFETASILHRIEMPLEEKHSVWRTLLEQTEDNTLKEQLAQEIRLDQKDLELLHTRTDGSVYMIRGHLKSVIGLAGNYETAYKIAMNRKAYFKIEKYEPPLQFRKPVPKLLRFNPYWSPDDTYLIPDDIPAPIVTGRFRKDGTLLSVKNEAKDDDPKARRQRLSPEYFINAVVEYPNPFERGDIVRRAVCREEYPEEDACPGIIATSQAAWATLLEELRSGTQFRIDGAELDVEWLTQKGGFCSVDTSPIFLERYEPEEAQPWYALIKAGSELMRGEGSLMHYMICCDGYREDLQAKELAESITQRHNAFGV